MLPQCNKPDASDISALLWPALIAFVVAAFSPSILGDGDSWWHVAAGQWMLDHRTLPRVDLFSYTYAGRAWYAHEWLSEVLYAAAFRAAGWSGVVVLAAGAFAATIGLVHQRVRRFVSPVSALVATVLLFACIGPSLLARPHLLALPCLAAWTGALLDARTRQAAPHPAWLLLIVVWANLHGSVLLGVALIGPFALEAVIEADTNRFKALRDWGGFGIAAALAMVLTPYGIDGAIFLVKLTQMASLARIVEWMPPKFSGFEGTELLLFTGLFLFSYRQVRLPILRLLLLLALTHMALQHQRHQMILAIIGILLCCEAPALQANRPGQHRARSGRWYPALAMIGLLIVTGVRLWMPVTIRESATAPIQAFAHVPIAYRQLPVLNDYGAGGYLIAQGVKPYIDGRTDLYGDAFLKRYYAILDGKPGALEQAIKDYRIAWTILPPGAATLPLLDKLPGWRRIYGDKFAVVHVRALPAQ
jgi:hypothetical protein